MASPRVVYSTGKGRLCAGCGWPSRDCHCAVTLAAGAKPVPEKPTAKIRLENRASGRHVTVIDGLPAHRGYLDDLCRELKRSCGAGGAASESAIELQGDQRERLRDLLPRKGIRVKG